MEITDLIQKFSVSRTTQQKAIFSSIFIIGNRLQTLFDNHIPLISLKQFMLLSLVHQSKEQLTFTQLGKLLGCSRQNITKLASILEKKGFISIQKSPNDMRALCICPTPQMNVFFCEDFTKYQKELDYLFDIYSDEELEVLFNLLMKWYSGISDFEKLIDEQESK